MKSLENKTLEPLVNPRIFDPFLPTANWEKNQKDLLSVYSKPMYDVFENSQTNIQGGSKYGSH
jgi:hypothetical protein